MAEWESPSERVPVTLDRSLGQQCVGQAGAGGQYTWKKDLCPWSGERDATEPLGVRCPSNPWGLSGRDFRLPLSEACKLQPLADPTGADCKPD